VNSSTANRNRSQAFTKASRRLPPNVMTREVPRPEQGRQLENAPEADILAGLWETAPFARLPIDAPPELKDLVIEIENPRRVYAIHRASRRHNFQQLVEKYTYPTS
jgi:hypothetical protein